MGLAGEIKVLKGEEGYLNFNKQPKHLPGFGVKLKGSMSHCEEEYVSKSAKGFNPKIYWLSYLLTFKLPEEVRIPDHLSLVRDLMVHDGSVWDGDVISTYFPAYLRNMILDIPIEVGEHQRFV